MKSTKQQPQFPKDHPYMKRLDEVLSHYFVLKTIDPAVHGEDYEEMKEMRDKGKYLKIKQENNKKYLEIKYKDKQK